jgi:UPF0042 nucleotide-binding protein
MAQTRLVIVTGLSGAGHSSTLNILEDLGFEAIDNLPISFLEQALGALEGGKNLAIGIDSRTRDMHAPETLQKIHALRQHSDLATTVLFLDCSNTVLERRFNVTRRRHPLAITERLSSSISNERTLLQPFKDLADCVIDTTTLSPTLLKQKLLQEFGGAVRLPTITLQSFSYKNGLPPEADCVFDVRFLHNPFYDEHLKALTGLDAAVGTYIQQDPRFAAFLRQLEALLGLVLEGYTREGKTYLTLAFGCTGGQHRSVFVTQKIATGLQEQGWMVAVVHREL